MDKYLRPGTRVTVRGGPHEFGTVADVRVVAEKFGKFEYRITYGDRIHALTGWLQRPMLTVKFPPGAKPKHLIFQLADDLFVNMGDYSLTATKGHDMVYEMSPHLPECLQATARAVVHNAVWAKMYPDHCPNCHGAGAFYDPGSRDEPPNTDPCHVCGEAGLCPRCGRSPVMKKWSRFPGEKDVDLYNTWLEQEQDCPHCGFNIIASEGFIDDIGFCGCYDLTDPTEYHRQEPEAGMTEQELLDWIRDNLNIDQLKKGELA